MCRYKVLKPVLPITVVPPANMAHLDLLIHKNYDFDNSKGFELSKETTLQGKERTDKRTLVSTLAVIFFVISEKHGILV